MARFADELSKQALVHRDPDIEFDKLAAEVRMAFTSIGGLAAALSLGSICLFQPTLWTSVFISAGITASLFAITGVVAAFRYS
jgi:hypothetical protein